MSDIRISAADQHLLDQIVRGDENGWRLLVDKFQQRLTAFTRSKLDAAERTSIAEDLVQETFVSFLKSAKTYRGQRSLESFLFRILRYRINDHFRSSGHQRFVNGCQIADQTLPAADITASQHAVSLEQRLQLETALSDAVFNLTAHLKERNKFRDLKVAEGLFFSALPNQQIAALIEVTENEVAVVKHRLVKRLQAAVSEATGADTELNDQQWIPNLKQIWEDLRPSCPKRTTLGKFTLEILPPEWADFVQFHVQQLGCDYCRANLSELSDQIDTKENDRVSQQLFQSTIGFLANPPHH